MAIFVAKNGSLQTIKGVFECKEMLREGVDYERYDWLCTQVQGESSSSNGYAGQLLIIGNVESYRYTINYDNIPASIKFFTLILSTTWSNNILHKVIRIKYPNKVYFSYAGSSTEDIYHFGDDFAKPLNVYVDKTKIVINDTTYSIENNSVCLMLSSTNRCPLNGKYSDIKVNGNAFYPCKLLRSIPAHLDSNGIARPANECGLIGADGKFYGKTNTSIGSFTVSND